jgi:hypothetical protein
MMEREREGGGEKERDRGGRRQQGDERMGDRQRQTRCVGCEGDEERALSY